MRTLKFLLLMTMATSLVVSQLPKVESTTSTEVIDGANADLDYVYTDGDDSNNVSDEAEEDDGEKFTAFEGDDEDTQYLVLGSKSVFDTLYFDIEDGMDVDNDDEDDKDCDEDEKDKDDKDYCDEENTDLTWQYNDGDSWKELDVNDDNTRGFKKTGVQSVEFDLPENWDMAEYEGKDAYWVRARLEGQVDTGAEINQVSAIVYNVSVTVEDDHSARMTELTYKNFKLGNGSDNHIYGWNDMGNGTYALALQTEANDTDYTVMVDREGYRQYGVQSMETGTETKYFRVQLMSDDGCDVKFEDISFHWSQDAVENLYCRGIVEGDGSRFLVNNTVTRAEFIKMAVMNADIDTKKYDGRSVPYDDVDRSDWFYEYIATAYVLDAIDEDNRYNPEGEITRKEAVDILVRLMGLEAEGTATKYPDVRSSDAYAAVIRLATDYGVVEGYIDGTFKPNRELSRSESAVMINNAYQAWYEQR